MHRAARAALLCGEGRHEGAVGAPLAALRVQVAAAAADPSATTGAASGVPAGLLPGTQGGPRVPETGAAAARGPAARKTGGHAPSSAATEAEAARDTDAGLPAGLAAGRGAGGPAAG